MNTPTIRQALLVVLVASALLISVAACSSTSTATATATPGAALQSTAGDPATPTAVPPAPTANPTTVTPSCSGEVTPAQTAGPYYTPDTPMRASLIEPGTAGERLVITGSVFTRSCRPIAGAWLDFWQADAKGDYDNTGYTLRGHQFTDSEGGYRLETIVPGEYPGRTPHIHVKVRPPGGEVLTSQLYLPGEPGNRTDGIFDPALVMSVIRFGNDTQAVFDFVLDLE